MESVGFIQFVKPLKCPSL